ncbi:MAG: RecX family transcriptional regulator [Chloroflexi bacterium]|nr:RecX family transcriptional regulator [Chloroflexota bacterium]
MGRITSIKEQRSNGERVNVYIDGRYAFPVSRSVAEGAGLRPGMEVSADDARRLRQSDLSEKAKEAAFRLLAFRPRSLAEIRIRLERKGFDSEIVEAVLGWLQERGYLDDREFARFWIENREAFNPRGTRLLQHELRQKGVDTEIVDEALSEGSVPDEEAAALDLARRKAQTYKSLDRAAFTRRLMGFLQRRGYGYGVCSKVARKVWNERSGLVGDEPPTWD